MQRIKPRKWMNPKLERSITEQPSGLWVTTTRTTCPHWNPTPQTRMTATPGSRHLPKNVPIANGLFTLPSLIPDHQIVNIITMIHPCQYQNQKSPRIGKTLTPNTIPVSILQPILDPQHDLSSPRIHTHPHPAKRI